MWTYVGQVVAATWQTLADASPYLLFGFLVAGIVQAFVSADLVARHLGRGWVSSPIKAALFGIPLPLCSCGVLPAAMNLRKKGASRGAVLAFLVSTPETGADSIVLSFALLGPVLALFRPLAAFVTAVAAGVWENLVGGEDGAAEAAPHGCGCGADEATATAPVAARLRAGLRFAFGDLLGDLAPWLGVGFVVAGVITASLPEGFLAGPLGTGPLSYLVMLAAGVPLYLCATASTPIAAALLVKGLSPGAALVFLLAGPATNAATVTALSGALGWRTTLRYLAAISLVSVGMGALLDALFPLSGRAARAMMAGGGELFPPAVGVAAALLFLALIVRRFLPRQTPPPHPCPGST
ncbi:MAG: SO_0444 family Cu/Zn efflux transporter [Deltaproteobacteria bacterium]|nr:SO_0444 family Cu/Zn efflux transporter [Deltaproteobacteria bacterium]